MSREELIVVVFVAWMSQSCSEARAPAGSARSAAAATAINVRGALRRTS
jgi:hypothetical protein